MAWLLGGMRGWPGGTWAWLSSGDSTVSLSTPFASPLEGSGAFRQAYGGLVMPCDGVRFMLQRTWMRFLPSGLVTSGCSFGVVKV